MESNMRGTAAERPEENNKYQFDAQGHLVREENEDDATYQARVADVLYKEGMSPNHPDDVTMQYDEAPPPELEMEEGESQQDFNARRREREEEIGKKNAERRNDREPESQRRESRERQKQYDEDLDHTDKEKEAWNEGRENRRIREEAHATERSKRAEESSHGRGPQPQRDETEDTQDDDSGIVDVRAGPVGATENDPRRPTTPTQRPRDTTRPQGTGSQFANKALTPRK
jgi:Mg-chelatase subunit ChlI